MRYAKDGESCDDGGADLQLRGADAVYVAVAHLVSVPLAAWDQEMQAGANGFIEVVQP